MERNKRSKTYYPGVYYLVGPAKHKRGKEKTYYIRYRRQGKLVEERVGRQIADGMTPSQAALIRLQRMAEIPEPTPPSPPDSTSAANDSDAVIQFRQLGIDAGSTGGAMEDPRQLSPIMEALFRSSSVGISVADTEGNLVACNETSARFAGVAPETFIGVNARDLVAEGIIDRSAILEAIAKKRQVTVIQHIIKSGRYLLVTATPVFDARGNMQFVVLNDRDITPFDYVTKNPLLAGATGTASTSEPRRLTLSELREHEIIGRSDAIRSVFAFSRKLARLEASEVLILGETGTGKGLMAKFIHRESGRRDKPFVPINCAAIPEALLEAELFGYERGAFTGASPKGRVGLIEMARGGTLFLDEIGDLPLAMQAKLLRYLDDREFRRVGGHKMIHAKCTVISATNQNLDGLIAAKQFRADLYYRLNGFSLTIPPLRQRPGDIHALVAYYLNKYNARFGLQKQMSPGAMARIVAYPFPGNVRELKNVVKNALLMSDRDRIDRVALIERDPLRSTDTPA